MFPNLKTCFLLLFFMGIQKIGLIGQSCEQLFGASQASIYHYSLKGVIDRVHPITIELCIQNNDVKGHYTILSSGRIIDLEGILKNDSIFVAEYSTNSTMIGSIKAVFTGGIILGLLSSKNEKFSYGIFATQDNNIRLSDFVPSSIQDCKYFEDNANAVSMLSFTPSPESGKLFINQKDHIGSFLLSGKPLNKNKSKYFPLTNDQKNHNYSISIEPQSGQLNYLEEGGHGGIATLKTSLQPIAINFLDRQVAYEIQYFVAENDTNLNDAIQTFTKIIQHRFDSISKEVIRTNPLNERNDNRRIVQLHCWFEPTCLTAKVLSGHFITNYGQNQFEITPFTYLRSQKKNIDISELIRVPKGETLSWSTILRTEDSEVQDWSSPSIGYHHLVFSTPFDRVFDRQLYLIKSKRLEVKWKWWKMNYWIIRKWIN